MKRRCGRAGFTLIEVLLAVSIAAAVALTATTFFFRGIQIYERFQKVLEYENHAFWIEKLTRDLKNGARYSAVPWTVSKDTLSFPSFVASAGPDAPCRITWVFDDGKKVITRTESAFPYAEARKTENFSYPVRSLDFKASRDSEESIPSALTLKLEYGQERSPRELSKTILILAGHREVAR